MSYAFVSHPIALGSAASALVKLSKNQPTTTQDAMPEELRTFMARLRLLEGVPFSHLVPDADLLPAESIRFFHVDREWTDALVEGVLSVGTVNTLDREQLQVMHARIRAAIDTEERRVRVPGGDPPGFGPAGAITGFVLRSAAVSGWPGLHVRAYSTDVDDHIPADHAGSTIRLLRLERLAPAVLLCLFDGVPRVIHIEEPRQGIQFGVDLEDGRARIKLRDAQTSLRIDGASVDVPFRKGAPGVVHVRALADEIAAEPRTHVTGGTSSDVDSAELAMQLLQFPFRQVFGPRSGAPDHPLTEVFRPTIALDEIHRWRGGNR